MVLTGTINKQIVSGINAAGGHAVGLSGKDGSLITAKKLERMKMDPVTLENKLVDLGFVGVPEKINPEVLRTFIKSDLPTTLCRRAARVGIVLDAHVRAGLVDIVVLSPLPTIADAIAEKAVGRERAAGVKATIHRRSLMGW